MLFRIGKLTHVQRSKMCLVALRAAVRISSFPELRVSRLSSSKFESFRSSSGKIASDVVYSGLGPMLRKTSVRGGWSIGLEQVQGR